MNHAITVGDVLGVLGIIIGVVSAVVGALMALSGGFVPAPGPDDEKLSAQGCITFIVGAALTVGCIWEIAH